MRGLLTSLLVLLGMGTTAHAAELRVAAVPPLSSERLRDALRSYVDSAGTVVDSAACQDRETPPTDGRVYVCLGKDAPPDAMSLLLVDAEESIVARFPASTRTEDLYRAAALKVHGVLSRRNAPEPAEPPTIAQTPAAPLARNAPPVVLDLGLALFVPRLRPAQGAFKIGLAIPRGRLSLGAGAYLLSAQATTFQGVTIQQRDIPLYAALAFSPMHGRLRPEGGLVFHGVIRRAHATGLDGSPATHTGFSPRLGASAGALFTVSPWYTAIVRLSGVWALADNRYLVDGQTAVPEGGATLLLEMGLVSPGL